MLKNISHTYAVFDPDKVFLLYEVQFKIGLPQNQKLIPCDICKANRPTDYNQFM